MSLRETILSAQDRKTKTIDVPEWSAKPLRLRELSIDDMKKIRATGTDEVGGNLLMVALSVCNEDGTRTFTDDDVKALGNKNWRLVVKVANEAITFNGIDPDEADDAGN